MASQVDGLLGHGTDIAVASAVTALAERYSLTAAAIYPHPARIESRNAENGKAGFFAEDGQVEFSACFYLHQRQS